MFRLKLLLKKNFTTPFYGLGSLKATEPLQENSLLFTTWYPGLPGTHLVNLRRMKG